MTDKYKLDKTLIIVESPAKCKKIEQILGPGYKVIASFGHLRELKTLTNVDVSNNFNPKYQIIDDERKRKNIDFMRKEIANSDTIILATDDDREGESIAWHICALFNLSIEKTKRIVFHEITESAIQFAVFNPRNINMNLVYSQQARQILDLLVGFTISPLLWKYITKNAENSLSAGRCQTPALKLIRDNQNDITFSPGVIKYNTIGYFTKQGLPFELDKQYDDKEQIVGFLEESVNFDHVYSCSNPRKIFKKQPDPLTTSRLQQLASNEMHISPKETMKLCQTLYENGYITYMRTDSNKYSKEFVQTTKEYIMKEFVDGKYINPNIDDLINCSCDSSGENIITFSPDESNNNSEIKSKNGKVTKKLKEILKENMKENVNEKTKENMKERGIDNLKQEAHEAIRPTNILIKNVDEKMESREKRLYKLIWETSLESCMSQAEYFSITAIITAPFETKYSYSSEIVNFYGWKKVKNNNKTNDKTNEKTNDKTNEKANKEYVYLQTIKSMVYEYKKILSSVVLTDAKSHYTEARLVQLLEENGIGRPSTFSTIIEKIQERGYVKKDNVNGRKIECVEFELESDTITENTIIREFGNEKNKLIIQPTGIIVIDFLEKYFKSLFNYEYTKSMEDDLDKVSKGEIEWAQVCKSCVEQMDLLCIQLTNEMKDKKREIKIDENNSYIIGKYGPVIKCVDSVDEKGKDVIVFKQVKKDIDLKRLENGEYKVDELIDDVKIVKSEIILGKYQGFDLHIKKGMYGLYVIWGENRKSLSYFGNRPIENITYEEVLHILMENEKNAKNENDNENNNKRVFKKDQNIIRKINTNISIRNGKYGDYIFLKTSKMKTPIFYKLNGFKENYKSCNLEVIKEWISSEYKIKIDA